MHITGHIRSRGRRKDGTPRWEARYVDPTRRGNAKIARTFSRKQDAQAWLVAQQAAIQSGTHVSPQEANRPFDDIIAAWKESWGARLSPTTTRRYQSIIDKYLVPEFGAIPVGRITHEVVQRYINRL